MKKKTTIFVSISVVLVLLDQVSKYWIRHTLCLQPSRVCELPTHIQILPGWLQFVHVENRGAAFGLLNTFEYRMWVFFIFTLIAVWVMISMYRQLEDSDRFLSTTLGLIMAGAIGNGIDRVDKQAVTDFIRVYTENPELSAWFIEKVGTNEYPSFNVADMSIVVGVGLFFFHYLFLEDRGTDAGLAENVDENTAATGSEKV